VERSLYFVFVLALALAVAPEVDRGFSPASQARRKAAATLSKAGVEAKPERLNCFLQHREGSKQEQTKFFPQKHQQKSLSSPQTA